MQDLHNMQDLHIMLSACEVAAVAATVLMRLQQKADNAAPVWRLGI